MSDAAPQPPQPILSAVSVTHLYGSVKVLENLSCTIGAHGVTGIMAPSGAGKSTLLRLMLGLETPTDGYCVRALNGSDIGLVFQEDNLLPWLTTAENLSLAEQLYGSPLIADRLKMLLHELSLEEFLDAFPRELSTGMRQKAALCRLLASQSAFFAIDEGMANIDDLTRFFVCDHLRHRVRNGSASGLLITHNPTDALHLCDRLLIGTSRPLRRLSEFRNPLPPERDATIRFSRAFLTALEDLRKCIEQA